MATVKPSYGAATAFTITLNSLASAGAATATAIDNTTDLALDILVEIVVVVGTVGTNPNVACYWIPSVDGTNYGDTTNAQLIGVISTPTSSGTYRKTMSVAAAFGGNIPPKGQLYVVNNTGAALAATGNSAQYRELQATVA